MSSPAPEERPRLNIIRGDLDVEQALERALNREQLPLGRLDPAYMPPSPREYYQAVVDKSLGKKPKPFKQWSSAELEAWVEKAPEVQVLVDETPQRNGTDSYYNDCGRAAARLALRHLTLYPDDAVNDPWKFWVLVERDYPELRRLPQYTYHLKLWAQAAALRIFDSYRYKAPRPGAR